MPSVGLEEIEALHEPLNSGWLTQGPKVAAFERAFAERHGVPSAIATSSGTTALHLAFLAMGISPGDEVIVPAFTWVSTANAVLYCGGTPVFADVDPATFNIDVEDAAQRVTARTKAVVAVHMFGLCAEMDKLRAALPAHVLLVEDAACAAGASYKGKPAGSLGDAAVFSFHPRKTITTGEGGMLTTTDYSLAGRASALRNHGGTASRAQRELGPRPYFMPDIDMLGFNYRMTDLQAAVGLAQLAKLDGFIAERRQWAAWYGEQLAGIPWLRTPRAPEHCQHSWQSYVVMIDAQKAPLPRNGIMDRLHSKGIATRPGTHAVHMLGLYRDRQGKRPEDHPRARDCQALSISLPLHNKMSADDYAYVADALRDM